MSVALCAHHGEDSGDPVEHPARVDVDRPVPLVHTQGIQPGQWHDPGVAPRTKLSTLSRSVTSSGNASAVPPSARILSTTA
ncbi:hypothetical protein ACFQ1S_31945, partial [Kibdelosporangium lantanae]